MTSGNIRQAIVSGWDFPVAAEGDGDILRRHKTAFFCSRRYPAKVVLPIYDWAKQMREQGKCVISGFHSALERDVLDILLRGEQPIIIAAARALPHKHPAAVRRAVNNGRMLVLSPNDKAKKTTPAAARLRNEFIAAVADCIVIGHAGETGELSQTLAQLPETTPVKRLVE